MLHLLNIVVDPSWPVQLTAAIFFTASAVGIDIYRKRHPEN